MLPTPHPPRKTVTFQVGQAVAWPASPLGLAQISELRRSRVRICYPCKSGRIRQPIVSAAKLAEEMDRLPVLPLANPFNRAVLPRQRSFQL